MTTGNIDLGIEITKEEMAASIRKVPEDGTLDPLKEMNDMLNALEVKDDG